MDAACHMLEELRAFGHLRFYYVDYIRVIQRMGETIGNYSRGAWHTQQRIYLEIVANTSLLRAYTVVGVDPQFFYLYTCV